MTDYTVDRLRAWPANIEGDNRLDQLDAAVVRQLLDEAAARIEALEADLAERDAYISARNRKYREIEAQLAAAQEALRAIDETYDDEGHEDDPRDHLAKIMNIVMTHKATARASTAPTTRDKP